MSISPRYHDLLSLFPQFLPVRRRGWAGLQDILQSSGLQRPLFFLLMALVQETDPAEMLSQQEMAHRLFNPYSTLHTFDDIPPLLEKGYLSSSGNRYLVTPRGRTLIEQTEQAARDYVTTLTPLPLAELTPLATILAEVAQRMWQAHEPTIKAHQARCHRLPPIAPSAPTMVHLEAAIFALWMARDDAHIAAWQAEGLSGPHLDLLTRLWKAEAHTLPELTTVLQHSQHPEHILQGVTVLREAGYVLVEGEQITLTTSGQQVRTHIEEETDRIYFTPWLPLTPADPNWLYSSLKKVCDALST